MKSIRNLMEYWLVDERKIRATKVIANSCTFFHIISIFKKVYRSGGLFHNDTFIVQFFKFCWTFYKSNIVYFIEVAKIDKLINTEACFDKQFFILTFAWVHRFRTFFSSFTVDFYSFSFAFRTWFFFTISSNSPIVTTISTSL